MERSIEEKKMFVSNSRHTVSLLCHYTLYTMCIICGYLLLNGGKAKRIQIGDIHRSVVLRIEATCIMRI